MNDSRPETPAAECLRLVDEFKTRPEESGKKLAAIGREHGYHTIVPSVNTLWDSCIQQEEREVLAFLRQPEWVWRRWADNPQVCVAGLHRATDGAFVPVGCYTTGSEEDGTFTTLDLEGTGEVLEYVPGTVEDPRPRIKPRLFVKNKKYYVALVGKVAEFIRAGYDQAQIVLTDGKGYFKRHEAYVIRSGPMPVDKAKKEKIEHCVSPTPKKA